MNLQKNFVTMLRGGARYSSDCKDIAELARMFYQDGKSGRPFEHITLPVEAEAQLVELLDNLFWKCFDQGQQDAMAE